MTDNGNTSSSDSEKEFFRRFPVVNSSDSDSDHPDKEGTVHKEHKHFIAWNKMLRKKKKNKVDPEQFFSATKDEEHYLTPIVRRLEKLYCKADRFIDDKGREVEYISDNTVVGHFKTSHRFPLFSGMNLLYGSYQHLNRYIVTCLQLRMTFRQMFLFFPETLKGPALKWYHRRKLVNPNDCAKTMLKYWRRLMCEFSEQYDAEQTEREALLAIQNFQMRSDESLQQVAERMMDLYDSLSRKAPDEEQVAKFISVLPSSLATSVESLNIKKLSEVSHHFRFLKNAHADAIRHEGMHSLATILAQKMGVDDHEIRKKLKQFEALNRMMANGFSDEQHRKHSSRKSRNKRHHHSQNRFPNSFFDESYARLEDHDTEGSDSDSYSDFRSRHTNSFYRSQEPAENFSNDFNGQEYRFEAQQDPNFGPGQNNQYRYARNEFGEGNSTAFTGQDNRSGNRRDYRSEYRRGDQPDDHRENRSDHNGNNNNSWKGNNSQNSQNKSTNRYQNRPKFTDNSQRNRGDNFNNKDKEAKYIRTITKVHPSPTNGTQNFLSNKFSELAFIDELSD